MGPIILALISAVLAGFALGMNVTHWALKFDLDQVDRLKDALRKIDCISGSASVEIAKTIARSALKATDSK